MQCCDGSFTSRDMVQKVTLANSARELNPKLGCVQPFIPWYGTIGLFQPIRSLADREIIANTIPRGMIFIINWVHFYRTYYGAPCIGMPPPPLGSLQCILPLESFRPEPSDKMHYTEPWRVGACQCRVHRRYSKSERRELTSATTSKTRFHTNKQ